ncbi:AsmA family protein [Celerinatantimonas sp. YJH-8]|uniref:AsmA family protein n=1 Tax=Celerinatantimonas sp. YJH-8 TaxID=3228714 RepID=UPI0038CA8602
MRKIIWIIIILIVVFIAAILSFTLTMSSKDLKPVLEAEIKAKTGRDLTIDGNVQWQFWPELSLSARSLKLKDDPDYRQGNLLSIGQMAVAVSPWGLFNHHLELGEIKLSSVQLHWMRRKDGQNNLQSLLDDVRRASGQDIQFHSNWKISAQGVKISDARIDIDDQMKGRAVKIYPLNAEIDGISTTQSHHFELDYAYDNGHKQFTSNAKGDLRIDQDWTLWVLTDYQQHFEFSGELAKEIQQATISGGGTLNTRTLTLNVRPLSLAINGQSPVSGEVNVDMTKQPVSIDFNLSAGQLQLPAAQFLLNELASYQDKLFSKIEANGQVKADALHLGPLVLGNFLGSVTLEKGLLSVQQVTADFYDGNLTANTSLQLDQVHPKFDLNLDLAGVNSQLLFRDLCQKPAPFSGTLRLSSQFSVQTPVESFSGLKGRIQINLSHLLWNDPSMAGNNLEQLAARLQLDPQSVSADSFSVQLPGGTQYLGQGSWNYDQVPQLVLHSQGKPNRIFSFQANCELPQITLQ